MVKYRAKEYWTSLKNRYYDYKTYNKRTHEGESYNGSMCIADYCRRTYHEDYIDDFRQLCKAITDKGEYANFDWHEDKDSTYEPPSDYWRYFVELKYGKIEKMEVD